MDHHCPWTGTCVGKGNYKLFFLMMSYTVASSAYHYWTSGSFACELRREIDQGEISFTDENLDRVEESINAMMTAMRLTFGMMVGVTFLIM